MSAKLFGLPLIMIVAVVTVGCHAGLHPPVGPLGGTGLGGIVVVVRPVPPPPESMLTFLMDRPNDYTGWSWEYRDTTQKIDPKDQLARVDSYMGLPRDLGTKLGVEKILVTELNVAEPIDATKVVIKYVVLHDLNDPKDDEQRTLTIDLTKGGPIPVWTLDYTDTDLWTGFQKPATKELPSHSYVPLQNWSGSLYGHITKVDITARDSKPRDSITFDQLVKLQVFYYPLPPPSK
jgi:hypothetical protein